MEDNSIQPTTISNEEKGTFSSWLTFMVQGFVFSCFSKSFYKEAARKKLIHPIIFFILFGLLISVFQTNQVISAMNEAAIMIQDGYENGNVPKIVIEDGVATVDGPQPIVFVDEDRKIIAIDTTGDMEKIDTQLYNEGVLLTRSEVHQVSENRYQIYKLAEFNQVFGNPIIADKEHVLKFWATFSTVINVIAFVSILIWNIMIRFIYIMFIGLIIWGIGSLFQKGIGYGPVLITGIYANVPVIYLTSLLKLLTVSFITLYSILLILIWAIMLWQILKKDTVAEIGSPINAM